MGDSTCLSAEVVRCWSEPYQAMCAEEHTDHRKSQISVKGWKLVLYAFVASSFVLFVSLIIQWLVYDDWLRRTGPLHLVGTSIAALLTFIFAVRWQHAVNQREQELVRRFEMILQMNDRIRNALQAIECVTYLSDPQATDSVRQSVNNIDAVLLEVLKDTNPSAPTRSVSKSASAGTRKSA
jgi:hypothetical protein